MPMRRGASDIAAFLLFFRTLPAKSVQYQIKYLTIVKLRWYSIHYQSVGRRIDIHMSFEVPRADLVGFIELGTGSPK